VEEKMKTSTSGSLFLCGITTLAGIGVCTELQKPSIERKLSAVYELVSGDDKSLSKDEERLLLYSAGFNIELDDNRIPGVSYRIRISNTNRLELIDKNGTIIQSASADSLDKIISDYEGVY
jgi:hypothetical protein